MVVVDVVGHPLGGQYKLYLEAWSLMAFLVAEGFWLDRMSSGSASLAPFHVNHSRWEFFSTGTFRSWELAVLVWTLCVG